MDRRRMLRGGAAALYLVGALAVGSCAGDGDEGGATSETPAAEEGDGDGILGPADRSRDTRDDLNEQQREREERTGSGY